jgi:hypothetical protein
MPVNDLQYTLLSDGPTDKALIPILTWLLYQHFPHRAVQAYWADLRLLIRPPRTLHERIQAAVNLYPCDLIFVHRDAERVAFGDRTAEIDYAINRARDAGLILPAVAVVPVRMTETWLLFDESAIRRAAGNPNGSAVLGLPCMTDLECIPNPKNILHGLILEATERGTHRREHFKVDSAIHLIPQRIDDFSPLRVLPAFAALEKRIVEVIEERRWCD